MMVCLLFFIFREYVIFSFVLIVCIEFIICLFVVLVLVMNEELRIL